MSTQSKSPIDIIYDEAKSLVIEKGMTAETATISVMIAYLKVLSERIVYLEQQVEELKKRAVYIPDTKY